MELGPPGNCVAVWLAHGKGMIPMKQQWLAKGEVTYETAVLEVGKSKYGGNDFWYPAKVRILQTGPSYGKLVREVTVASFDPDPRITDKTFQLEFPPGTTVSDATTGAEYTVGAAAPAALTDLANATALRQPPPAVSASTTLPEKAVAATTSAADAAPLVDHRRRNIVVLMIAFLALAALVIVAAKRQRAGREVRRAE